MTDRLAHALALLQQHARPAELAGMARFGIGGEQRLGLSLIKAAAGDERNFVKKSVNWALRNIGKRNPALNAATLGAAQCIQQQGSRSARWIAADALRELSSVAVQTRLQKHTK